MKVLASHVSSQSPSCTSLPGFAAGNSIPGNPCPRRKLFLFGVHGPRSLHMAPQSETKPISRSLRDSSYFPSLAVGTNFSQDTDDNFDDLFERYGKVVYKSSKQKSPAADVDDDAESLSFAVAAAKVASDVKAADIKVLFVKPLVYWTKIFIITTAFSRPRIDAIGSRI